MADSMTTEDRIAHFLKLAEDSGATQHERDIAAAQAERLMIKHGIDRATAMAADSNQKRDEKIVTTPLFFGGTYGEARLMSAFALVRALKLQAYKSQAYGIDGANSHAKREVAGVKLHIIGFESDVRDAVQLIGSLDIQSSVAVKEWAKSQKDAWFWYGPAEKTRAKQTFIRSFGIGAAERITEERRVVVEEASSGTALVLVSREKQVKAHLDGMSGIRKSRARSRMYDPNGANAGRSAGYNANTGGKSIGGNARAISR